VIELPVAAGRNLAVLTEAAVRLHLLRSKGQDPAAAFLARHSSFLQQGEP
jgi:HPr kinase/phosphorylase